MSSRAAATAPAASPVDPFAPGLSVAEFAALRSVGYEPIGPVLGECVHAVGLAIGFCGVIGPVPRSGRLPVVSWPNLRAELGAPRREAIRRMRKAAADLRATGIVGVNVTIRPSPGGTRFVAFGTAVRAGPGGPPRPRRAPRLFDTDLSGQDLARLVLGGFAPVRLVVGVSVVLRHSDVRLRRQRRSFVNQELDGATDLVTAARSRARQDLAADTARFPGSTVVVRDLLLEVDREPCERVENRTDHRAVAMVWGTAILPLPHRTPSARPQTLPIMRLDDRSRTEWSRHA
jgi:uncharacterized protein YbjQ (UPF0145 family)